MHPVQTIRRFLRLESAGGILLMAAAAVAVLAANTGLSGLYEGLLKVPLEIRVGNLEIAKPLLLWINDGLMAIFFLLIGLEVKREILEGQLSNPAQVALPAVAAVGGMVVPALFYVFFNRGDAAALSGWAIPAATDIAFALGVLALLGSRVPVALKVFLLALAILDDLGAIVIIAVFYSSDLSGLALLLAVAALGVLVAMNVSGVTSRIPYAITGTLLWVFVLKSGVHATLAGVAMALAVPLRGAEKEEDEDDYDSGKRPDHSPLKAMEHSLHPWVAYAILPIFAFANAGVSLEGLTLASFLEPVTLGIFLGLFLGKQIGVFGFSWLAVRLGLATLPAGVRWVQLYGVSILCGIGFTMSLFIGSLAFEHLRSDAYLTANRVGILAGSLVSAVVGYLILRLGPPAEDEPEAP